MGLGRASGAGRGPSLPGADTLPVQGTQERA